MPSPQCVGQEFVRQYYTLLHQAPEHMHRYSYLASFVIQFSCTRLLHYSSLVIPPLTVVSDALYIIILN